MILRTAYPHNAASAARAHKRILTVAPSKDRNGLETLNAMRNFAGLLVAVIVGFIGVYMIFVISGGACSAETKMLVDPWGALLSTPWPPDPPDAPFYGIDDSPACEPWPTLLETWLLLWLPVIGVLLASGFLAARLASGISLVRCALAGAASISLYLVPKLVDLLQRNQEALVLSPNYKHHPDPSSGVTFVIAAATVGALLGLAGGLLKRRSQREPNDLLHHPERLDQMLDPTDDA